MKRTYPKLERDLAVDTAIVGGGLTGVITAYLLSKKGTSVAVLESNKIGSGATAKTTAFLTQVVDTYYTDLINMFGKAKAKLIWDSHGGAVDKIEKIINQEKIACDFMRCPFYYYANTSGELEDLVEEFDAWKKLGINTDLQLKNSLPFENLAALKVAKQAKFSAEKFITALAAIAAKKGAQIFEKTKVAKISGKTLYTGKHKIKAKNIIVATYYPFNNPKATHYKKGMYETYVFTLQIKKGLFEHGIYEDLDNPYHYFRIDPAGKYDHMTIGGEDHRDEIPMDPKKNYRALTGYIKETFPGLKYKILSRWSGPILEPSDGLALIGEYKPGAYVASAFSGTGMTYAMIAGLMFADMLTGKRNPWQKLYDPKRTPTVKQLAHKGRDYTGILAGGAVKNIFK